MFYVLFFLVIAPPQLWESQRLGGIPPEKALVPTIPGAGSSKSTHGRDSICAHLARPTMQRSVQYIRNTTRKRPREWMVFAYIIYNMHCTHLLLSIALCQWVKGHYDIIDITIVKLVITVLNISISSPRAEIVTNPFLLS